jgi:transcription initiation factor TFIIB
LTTKINEIKVCIECGGTQFIEDHDSGELVCRSCGYVISSKLIDMGPDWRAFTKEQRDKLPRAGAPSSWTIYDKGLSTTIGWQDIDSAGKVLDPAESAKLQRLRKLHRRIKVSGAHERNLVQALNEINQVGYRLSLPRNVLETSSVIYRGAVEKNLIRGRPIRNMAIASVYLACRQCGVVRTIDEVASAASLSRKDIATNYRHLLRVLKTSVPLSEPEGYIGKLVSKLSLTGEVEHLSKVILNAASDLKLTIGRGPQGIAAACVYISCKLVGEEKTQGQIAQIAQITEVTIRNRYKELTRQLTFKISL